MSKLTRRDFVKGAAALAALPPIHHTPMAPARAAIVGEYAGKLDAALTTLLEARHFLVSALATEPAQVDGLKWLEYEARMGRIGEELEAAITPELTEKTYQALTGRSVDYWVTRSLIVERRMAPDMVQNELRALRQINPAEAAELEVLLNEVR